MSGSRATTTPTWATTRSTPGPGCATTCRSSAGPVLELACGRGEFLGAAARGRRRRPGRRPRRGHGRAGPRGRPRRQLGDALERPAERRRRQRSGRLLRPLRRAPASPTALRAVVAESARVLRARRRTSSPRRPTPAACRCSATTSGATRPTSGFYDPRLLAFFCRAGRPRGGRDRRQPAQPRRARRPATLRAGRCTSTPTCDRTGHRDPAHRRRRQEQGGRRRLPVARRSGHFVGVLEERLTRDAGRSSRELRRSYAQLLDQLYPPNEVYVVAPCPSDPRARPSWSSTGTASAGSRPCLDALARQQTPRRLRDLGRRQRLARDGSRRAARARLPRRCGCSRNDRQPRLRRRQQHRPARGRRRRTPCCSTTTRRPSRTGSSSLLAPFDAPGARAARARSPARSCSRRASCRCALATAGLRARRRRPARARRAASPRSASTARTSRRRCCGSG